MPTILQKTRLHLTPKIVVIRAISAAVARRALFWVSMIACVALVLLLAGIWALAQFESGWWWLLLIVYIPAVIVCLIVFIVTRILIQQLYSVRLSHEQKELTKQFTNKLQRLLESRGIGWWWFTILCVRDLILYRELRTFKDLLHDATGLKEDFTALEKALAKDQAL